jgi:hypothetical protein
MRFVAFLVRVRRESHGDHSQHISNQISEKPIEVEVFDWKGVATVKRRRLKPWHLEERFRPEVFRDGARRHETRRKRLLNRERLIAMYMVRAMLAMRLSSSRPGP